MSDRITDERLAELENEDHWNWPDEEIRSALRELRVLRRAIGRNPSYWKLDPLINYEYGEPRVEWDDDLEAAIMNAERELGGGA